MAPNENQIPTEKEIKAQLARIRSSRLFSSRKKTGDVLELLVSEAIKGNFLSEKQVRAELFSAAAYDETSTLVRTHINKIRNSLEEYYKQEGSQDPVHISLPVRGKAKGPSATQADPYAVIFRHNAYADHLKRAQRLVLDGSPANLKEANQFCNIILEHNPDNAIAAALKVECLCLMATYAPNGLSRYELISEAYTLSMRLFDENFPLPIALRAPPMVKLCSFQPARADHLFSLAFRHASNEEAANLWIPATLLLNGHIEAAVTQTASIHDLRADDSSAFTAMGIYAYLYRQFELAEEILYKAVCIFRNAWLPSIGCALLYLATDRPLEALAAHQWSYRLMQEYGLSVLPGVAHLASLRAKVKTPEYVAKQFDEMLKAPEEKQDWIQRAIAVIDQSPEASVASLRMAFELREPLAMLLRFWPLFDPLRERQDFQQLLTDISATLE